MKGVGTELLLVQYGTVVVHVSLSIQAVLRHFFYNLSNLRRDDEELAPFRKNLEMSVSQSEFRTACQPCHPILVVP